MLLDFLALKVDDLEGEDVEYSDEDEDDVFFPGPRDSIGATGTDGEAGKQPQCVVKLEYCGDSGPALAPGM